MGIPVYTDGEVLGASDVNTWFVPLVGLKGSDTGRASNTTPTADPDLQIPVVAAATYAISWMILYKGSTNGNSDGQFGLSAPSGSSGFWYVVRNQISSLTFNNILTVGFGGAVNVGTNGTGNPIGCLMSGTLVTGSTPGTFSFIWSQNTSNGTATTVQAGSWLMARRIS